MLQNQIDVALVTETWLTSDLSFSSPNYFCHSLGRTSSSGGGIATVLNKNFKLFFLLTYHTKVIEA